MEGLYLNADPEIKAMIRMYEFIEIEGLLLLDMFESRRSAQKNDTGELLAPTGYLDPSAVPASPAPVPAVTEVEPTPLHASRSAS